MASCTVKSNAGIVSGWLVVGDGLASAEGWRSGGVREQRRRELEVGAILPRKTVTTGSTAAAKNVDKSKDDVRSSLRS